MVRLYAFFLSNFAEGKNYYFFRFFAQWSMGNKNNLLLGGFE